MKSVFDECKDIGPGFHSVDKPYLGHSSRTLYSERVLKCVESARVGVIELPPKMGLIDLIQRANEAGYLNPNSVISYAVPHNGIKRGGLTSNRNY